MDVAREFLEKYGKHLSTMFKLSDTQPGGMTT
jgi:hypothetical protein